MLLSFELKMPNVGSWNGQWTGANKKYYIIKNVSKEDVERIQLEDGKKYFYYNFGDGWGASVNVEVVNAKEANIRRRHSCGFSTYEWMVSEIIKFGRIKTRDERIAEHTAQSE